MSLSGFRFPGSEPAGDPDQHGGIIHEERRLTVRTQLAVGTLACGDCDSPVAPGPHPLRPTDHLQCPFCGNGGSVRDFLSLQPPSRPARVVVRVSLPARSET